MKGARGLVGLLRGLSHYDERIAFLLIRNMGIHVSFVLFAEFKGEGLGFQGFLASFSTS